MTTVIMLMEDSDSAEQTVTVLAALVACLLFDLCIKIVGAPLLRFTGEAGVKVMGSIMGCLLAVRSINYASMQLNCDAHCRPSCARDLRGALIR
jgi:small neutral amino acid transporter SnatA (MarC family)